MAGRNLLEHPAPRHGVPVCQVWWFGRGRFCGSRVFPPGRNLRGFYEKNIIRSAETTRLDMGARIHFGFAATDAPSTSFV